jgi:hypothetical protein
LSRGRRPEIDCDPPVLLALADEHNLVLRLVIRPDETEVILPGVELHRPRVNCCHHRLPVSKHLHLHRVFAVAVDGGEHDGRDRWQERLAELGALLPDHGGAVLVGLTCEKLLLCREELARAARVLTARVLRDALRRAPGRSQARDRHQRGRQA